MKYSLSELNKMPTLCMDQTADLKLDTGTTRVWLSRCTFAHGEPYNNKVTVENRLADEWIITEEYQALAE